MDAWMVAAVAAEIRRDWTGARISRVVQPEPHTVDLELYRPGRSGWLLLSAHPQLDRVHLSAERPRATPTPPAFCQALRRHVEGSRLLGCTQPGLERVLELRLQGRDELGNPRLLRLLAELTGRLANLVLVTGDGRVLDALHRVGEERNRVRETLPGLPYAPPPRPADKVDPVLVLGEQGPAALVAALRARFAARADPEPAAERLQACVFGFTRPLAEAVAAWAAGAPGGPPPAPGAPGGDPLAAAVAALAASVVGERFRPCVAHDARGRPAALAWPLPAFAGTRPAATANLACAEAYAALEAARREQGLRQRLQAALRSGRARTERRLDKQRAEMRAAAGAPALREQGELLLCFPQLVPRGARSVTLPALEDPRRQVHIALDARLSPSANAQRLLRRYQKEKRAAGAVAARVAAGEDELRYLAEAELALEQAEAVDELQALAAELQQQGLLAARRQGAGRARPHPGPAAARGQGGALPEPLAFAAGGGWRILVGRNAAGNDRLTLRLGRPDDVWLHARQMPGSHVLLQPPAQGPAPAAALEPPEAALLAAARCAAYYSAGRTGRHIPVDWTRRRRVHKPAGARPGFVLYEGERTLIVDPVDLPPRAGGAPQDPRGPAAGPRP